MICLYQLFSPYMFKRAPKRKTASSTYSLHNIVKLVRGGKDYFDLLETLIVEAKYSIHVQVYIFDEDETGKRIASAQSSQAFASATSLYRSLMFSPATRQ